jgi:hypothetical protein
VQVSLARSIARSIASKTGGKTDPKKSRKKRDIRHLPLERAVASSTLFKNKKHQGKKEKRLGTCPWKGQWHRPHCSRTKNIKEKKKRD